MNKIKNNKNSKCNSVKESTSTTSNSISSESTSSTSDSIKADNRKLDWSWRINSK